MCYELIATNLGKNWIQFWERKSHVIIVLSCEDQMGEKKTTKKTKTNGTISVSDGTSCGYQSVVPALGTPASNIHQISIERIWLQSISMSENCKYESNMHNGTPSCSLPGNLALHLCNTRAVFFLCCWCAASLLCFTFLCQSFVVSSSNLLWSSRVTSIPAF